MRKKLKELSVYLLPFIIAVLIYAFITNYQETRQLFSGVTAGASFFLTRFLLGFGIAFVLDFFVKFLVRRLRCPRGLGIGLAYGLVLGLLALLLIFIVPMVFESIANVVALSQKAYVTLNILISTYGDSLDADILEYINTATKAVTDGVFSFFKNLLTYSTLTGILSASTRTLMDIFFGLMISLYVLIQKNTLVLNTRKAVYAFLKPRRAERMLEFTREANTVFSSFLVGKIIDSTIIMLLSLLLYSVFKLPLTPFLAVIAGVTNMIPYVGPIVGGGLTCFILLCFEPVYVLYALAIIIVLQTLDAFVIGPKILGDAVGISPLLIIIAITVGGDVAGFLGMFIGVPLLAVLKSMVYDRYIAERLRRRREELKDGGRAMDEALAEPPPKEKKDRGIFKRRSGR